MNTVPPAQELAADSQSTGPEVRELEPSDDPTKDSLDREEQAATFASWKTLLGKKQVRTLLGTVGSQGGIFGIQALHSILLARLLGPTQRGEYATVVFYSQTLVYAGLLGTLFSIARRATQETDNRALLANSTIRVGATTGLCCICLVGLLAWLALPAEKAYLATLCLFSALLLPFEHIRLALLAVDHGSGDFRRYNTNRLVSVSIFPLLLGIGWLAGILTLNLVLVILVTSSFLGMCHLLYVHPEVRPKAPAAPPAPVLIKEGLPYASAYFAAQLLGRLDMLLMLWFMSFTNQGYYAVALAAASLMHVIPNALALFAFNLGAQKDNGQSKKSFRLAVLSVMGAQFLTAVVLALVLGPLLALMFGSDFDNALPMCLVLLPGLAIDGIGTVAEGYLRGRGKPFSTLRPRILGAAVMVPTVVLMYGYSHTLAIPLGASVAHAVSGIAILWVLLRDRKVSEQKEAL